MGEYLRLIDYAMKYGVSLSTLRRRIKSGQLPYRLERGKYFLPDTPMATQVSRGHRPSQKIERSLYLGPSKELIQLQKEVVDLKMMVSVLEKELAFVKAKLINQ